MTKSGSSSATRERADHQSPLVEVKQKIDEAASVTREKVTEVAETLESKVRANPLTAVAIAVGAGMLIGTLFARRQ